MRSCKEKLWAPRPDKTLAGPRGEAQTEIAAIGATDRQYWSSPEVSQDKWPDREIHSVHSAMNEKPPQQAFSQG